MSEEATLMVLPVTLYLHYRYREEILAGLQWVFEYLGRLMVGFFLRHLKPLLLLISCNMPFKKFFPFT